MDEFFSKKLKKTDVNFRLSFPMKALNDFQFPQGKDKMEFEVTDHSSGKPWKFCLSKRNEARHSHPKPVISSGWRPYVKEKGLKVNDKIVVYVREDKLHTETRFKIRAQRKVFAPFKLFGKEMEVEKWVDVEEVDQAKGFYFKSRNNELPRNVNLTSL